MSPLPTRRTALAAILSGIGAGALAPQARSQQPSASPRKRKICAFIKFVQELSYEELAAKIAAMGYDGIEATVRKGGHVLPQRVQEDLPRLVEALRKEGLEISVMASDVNDPEIATQRRVLETAAELGVRKYRMRYFRYSLQRPVQQEIIQFQRQAKRLAEFNRRLQLTAVYQNHAGPRYLGATLWDLAALLRDIDPQEIGIAFDIRHATAAGGESWPVLWNVAQPHLKMVYVKDFHWARKGEGRQVAENVALGTGQVDPRFFALLGETTAPVSVHVEYLRQAGVPANLAALQADLNKLRQLLGRGG